ncbi:MAG: penicillin-binding protein 2 [Verrucomicrobiota bacterium]
MLEHKSVVPHSRQGYFIFIFLVAGLYMVYRLFDVTVQKNENYKDKLRNQTTIAIRLSPARGTIIDRNGFAIAENRASFDIDFYLDQLIRDYSRTHRGRIPKLAVEVKRKGRTIRREENDIVKIVNESVEPLKKTLGIEIKLDANDIRNHYRSQPRIPYPYKTDIDFNTLAQFSERNLGIPGIEIGARPIRTYNLGAFAPHIIGYIGRAENTEQVDEDGVELEFVGKKGIEEKMDSHLQGKAGGKILQVNYRGYIVPGDESEEAPTVGNSVALTIDARIQHIAEDAMRGVGRGAVVIMDPNNGDILAMVSVPNFDPNVFIPKISPQNWKELNTNPTAPMINRAVSEYAPGSIYKPIVALAALKSHSIRPSTIINCSSGYTVGNRVFHDWYKGDRGPITVREAIQWSCNTFFYPAGIRTGIDKLVDMARLFGIGQPTEIPLPEGKGRLWSPEWLKQNRPQERWSEAYTANFSIGQGSVEVTPLQMAVVGCAIANGGTVYYPGLVKSIQSIDGDVKATFPTRIRNRIEFDVADIDIVRQGMLAVVESGTATKAQVPGYKIAGKTGTAQFKTRLQGRLVVDQRTWFLSFAPYESPRYAICVLVEGGSSGGGTCAPIAQNIYARIFSMEKGETIPMSYLTPVEGHFGGVTDYVPPQATGMTATPNAPAAQAVPPETTSGDAPADTPNEDDDRKPSRILPRRSH